MNYEESITRILGNGMNQSRKGRKDCKWNTPLTPGQLDTLKAFKNSYETKVKTSSLWNILMSIRQLGIFLEGRPYKPAEVEIPEYREVLVRFVNQQKSASTREVSKQRLKTFYGWVYYGMSKKHNDTPALLDDSRLVSKRVPTSVRRENLPTPQEIQKMLYAADNPRDQAILLIWSESGCRAGEIVNTRIKDLTFDSAGCKLWIEESKTERRFVRLLNSTPYLRAWLNAHPHRDDPEAPLFTCMAQAGNFGRQINGTSLSAVIQRLGKHAGIKKDLWWHLGRHYTVSSLQRRGLDLVASAKRHGITTKTLESVYLQYSDEDCDNAYLTLNNARTEEDKVQEQRELDAFKPKKCSKCQKVNPSDHLFCDCGAPLDVFTALKVDEQAQQREKELTTRVQQMEAIMREIAKNLPSPTLINTGQEQVLVSVSGTQPFGKPFKKF